VPWHEKAAHGGKTGDQSLHQDISGDTMLIPTPGKCEGAQALLYYSDVEVNGGPTLIVGHPGPCPLQPLLHLSCASHK
jgi:hypothetical protein